MSYNSVIFRNPENNKIIDLSEIGILNTDEKEIEITQTSHFFRIGDAIYFDTKKELFSKAVAKNNISVEVCGVVSKIINVDKFKFITHGKIKTDRYIYTTGSQLYLSEVTSGHLTNIQPTYVCKPVATQLEDSVINVDIQMGFNLSNETPDYTPEDLENYTQEELDEIILNIKSS